MGVSQSRASWNGGSNFGAPQVHFNISIAEWDLNLICRCVGQFTLAVAWPSLMRHSQLKLGGNNKLRACGRSLSAGRGGQLSQVPVWGREREAILATSRSLASRILVVRRVRVARSTLVLTILWVSLMRDSTFSATLYLKKVIEIWQVLQLLLVNSRLKLVSYIKCFQRSCNTVRVPGPWVSMWWKCGGHVKVQGGGNCLVALTTLPSADSVEGWKYNRFLHHSSTGCFLWLSPP